MYKNINISIYENNNLLSKNTTTAFITEDSMEYNTENDNIKINLIHFSFNKENGDSLLKITDNECTLTLKELNQSLNIPLEYLNYNIENNNISLEYKLESQENPLKIIIDIGSDNNEI